MNGSRERGPGAQEGADNARPTGAARALSHSAARAGDVTPTVAGAFRLSNGGAFAVRLVDVPPLEGGGVARQTYL
jgi:hypothetical protein